MRSVASKSPLLGLAALSAALLSGCADKLDHFGRAPSFSGLAETKDPIDPSLPPGLLPNGVQVTGGPAGVYPGVGVGGDLAPAGRPGALWRDGYSTASAPGVQPAAYAPRRGGRPSLWSNAPGSLFHDRRARELGDILTVLIEIDDSASLNNSTDRSRSGEDTVASPTVYGLQGVAARVAQSVSKHLLPGEIDPLEGVSASGSSTSSGSGKVERDESISLRIAARVVQVLPNGHLVVTGNQEVRVNFELRDLQVAGIIRPEDITRQNTISYDRMANARISYGGRGQITDFQQPRIGQQLVDLISPF